MHRIRRSFCFAAVAALPFSLGVGVAHAEGISAGHERLYLGTDTNLTDQDQFLIDVRGGSVDDDGDANGVRSRTTSSDIQDVEGVRSDSRAVSNDEGNDSTSMRAILGIDDLGRLDSVDSDIDVLMIDQRRDENNVDSMSAGRVAGQEDTAGDEQQYSEDAEFVFGR